MYGMGEVEQKILRRDTCHRNCLLASFPDNSACEVRSDLAVVHYQGNTYTSFFNYSLPATTTDHFSSSLYAVNTSAARSAVTGTYYTPAAQSAATTSLQRRFSSELGDFQKCLSYKEREPLVYNQCTDNRREIADGKCERVVVCFSGCKITEAVLSAHLADQAALLSSYEMLRAS
ncbi:unnamed protein product [Amoebophrya sp. A120]|nr:unnamed protein product [Amoebophrya sp. A120]|eukprot:GSA120T00016082001.1